MDDASLENIEQLIKITEKYIERGIIVINVEKQSLKTSSALVYCLACLLSVLMDRVSAQAETIVVDTTEDKQDVGDGSCTLREAINNANVNIDTTNGDCLAGEGDSIIDVITLD